VIWAPCTSCRRLLGIDDLDSYLAAGWSFSEGHGWRCPDCVAADNGHRQPYHRPSQRPPSAPGESSAEDVA
jgi:hypothetical protein